MHHWWSVHHRRSVAHHHVGPHWTHGSVGSHVGSHVRPHWSVWTHVHVGSHWAVRSHRAVWAHAWAHVHHHSVVSHHAAWRPHHGRTTAHHHGSSWHHHGAHTSWTHAHTHGSVGSHVGSHVHVTRRRPHTSRSHRIGRRRSNHAIWGPRVHVWASLSHAVGAHAVWAHSWAGSHTTHMSRAHVWTIIKRIGGIDRIPVAGSHHVGWPHVPIGIIDRGAGVLAGPSLLLGVAARLGARGHPEILRHFHTFGGMFCL